MYLENKNKFGWLILPNINNVKIYSNVTIIKRTGFWN